MPLALPAKHLQSDMLIWMIYSLFSPFLSSSLLSLSFSVDSPPIFLCIFLLSSVFWSLIILLSFFLLTNSFYSWPPSPSSFVSLSVFSVFRSSTFSICAHFSHILINILFSFFLQALSVCLNSPTFFLVSFPQFLAYTQSLTLAVDWLSRGAPPGQTPPVRQENVACHPPDHRQLRHSREHSPPPPLLELWETWPPGQRAGAVTGVVLTGCIDY